jgi:O-acetyl-ADP-ribose deacetylase (regulator of RNase III)
MGKIIYREGDLLEAPENIITHQCNSMGKMASGIAGQIAKRFPEVKQCYLDKYNSIDGWKLGDIQPIKINNARTIINCCGQKYYGYDGKAYTN